MLYYDLPAGLDEEGDEVDEVKLEILDAGGEIIPDWDFLESLAGVGHKTAGVVMAQSFGVPSFPVDTHIHRLAHRWGLSDEIGRAHV